MSYTTMFGLPENGETVELEEFRNSSGSAWRVWASLGRVYFKDKPVPFEMRNIQPSTLEYMRLNEALEDGSMWKLMDDSRIERCERITLAWTFDWCIVESDKSALVAREFRAFDTKHPVKANHANHLPAVADALERHCETEDYTGFCFIQTSVAGGWDVKKPCADPFHSDDRSSAGRFLSWIRSKDEYCPTCGKDREHPAEYRQFRWDLDEDDGFHFLLWESCGE